MNSLLIAIQLLTIFPIRTKFNFSARDFSASLAYFPLVGLLIGLSCAAVNILLGRFLPDAVISIIIVLFMAFITGGMHSDGLADTVDGLGSTRSSEKMLEIMKDSRIGTMGVSGLFGSLALKSALIYSMPADFRNTSIILAMVISRWSMTLPLTFFNYARNDGKAKIFFENASKTNFALSTIVALGIIVFYYFRPNGIYLVIIGAAASYLTAFYINKKIKGITGDTLGAINEIVEIVSFTLIYTLIR